MTGGGIIPGGVTGGGLLGGGITGGGLLGGGITGGGVVTGGAVGAGGVVGAGVGGVVVGGETGVEGPGSGVGSSPASPQEYAVSRRPTSSPPGKSAFRPDVFVFIAFFTSCVPGSQGKKQALGGLEGAASQALLQ
jgi:hypothetical protein